jgi:hypothetical protein
MNCGFETGDFTDWTLTGNLGDISIAGGTYAHSGTYAAQFGAVGSPTFLTQDLSTVLGDTYNLAFFLENDLTCTAGACEFNVSWNGTQIYLSGTPTNFGYTEFTFSGLAATSSSTALQFSFQQNPSYYQFDDVVVTTSAITHTPEPGVLLLLSISLLGLAALAWKVDKSGLRDGVAS